MEHYSLRTLVVTFGLISVTLAATGIGPATVHDSNPGQCYVVQDDKYYDAGESWELEGCAMATCTWSNYSGSSQLLVGYQSCGLTSADPPCTVVEDLTLSYPQCCPEIECPETVENDDKETTVVPTIPDSAESKSTETKVDDTHTVILDPRRLDTWEYFPVKQSITDLDSNDISDDSITPSSSPTEREETEFDMEFNPKFLERFHFFPVHPRFFTQYYRSI